MAIEKTHASRTVTMQDVADHVGVTKMTVSRVLNGYAHVSPEIRENVERAIKELRYRPNSAAKAIFVKQFDAIAIVSTPIGQGYLPVGLIQGTHEEIARHNMHLLFATLTREQLSGQESMPKLLRELGVDGLILHNLGDVQTEVRELLAEYDIAAIWYNTKYATDCVYPDEVAAGRKATEYLIGLGHKKIAYLHCSGEGHFSAHERRSGYVAAMTEHGFDARCMTIYNGQDATGRLDPEFPGKLMGYLSNNRDLTGLVCYEKNAAGPVIHAASRLGIRVPEDLSVVAFSDGMATDLGINLTTMMVPMWDMAHCAVRMLLRKIQARDQELRGEAVEYTFHPGDTCRALS